MLATAKPAPTPISVPGHHISGALANQTLSLGQALKRTNIHPVPTVVLASDLAIRHGLTQQRRQLEGTGTATREQLGVEHLNATEGQVIGTGRRIMKQTLIKEEITARGMMRWVVDITR